MNTWTIIATLISGYAFGFFTAVIIAIELVKSADKMHDKQEKEWKAAGEKVGDDTIHMLEKPILK